MAKHPAESRREAICAWLTANGINPKHVPVDADMTISEGTAGRVLRCEVFDVTADGHRQVDERGANIAVTVVAVPLKVEPPAWWQPYEKPTRAQLLEGEEPYTDTRLIPTPAQWIWLWNRLSPAERRDRAQRVIDDREAASQCETWKHVAQIRDLEAQVSRVAQLAERWKHTGDRKNGPRRELLQALTGNAMTPEAP